MKKAFALVLTVALSLGMLSLPAGVTAPVVTASTLQEQINDKQSVVDSLQKRIDALAKEGEEQLAKKQLLEEQTEALEEEIDLTEEKIDKLEDDIADKTDMIAESEKEIVVRNEQMAERIRAIYVGGNNSYINLLFESKDFASFLETLDMLSVLLDADRKMISGYRETKTGLELAKAELEENKADLENTRSSLEAKKKKLDSNTVEIERLLISYEKAQQQAQEEMEDQYEQMRELIKRQSQGEFVGGEFMWPVAGFRTISAVFGQKGKYWKNGHTGMDICGYNSAGVSIKGQPILASNSGTVIDVNTTNTQTGYGNYVTISHGGGISTLYAHMMSGSATVRKGDVVTKGQIIGYVGTTGNSTGYHLHIEFILNGTRVDPANYISYGS